MAITKKGSRLITVGNQRYRWYVRSNPTYCQGAFGCPMSVAVAAVKATARRTLVVDLGISRPDNWITPHQTALTPALVARIIRHALAAGWEPDVAGPPCRMEYQITGDLSGP